MKTFHFSNSQFEKEAVDGVFSRAAATYDHIGPRLFSYFGPRLITHARIPAGAHLLDIATGRGAVLFPAAEAVGPTGRVHGIDLSAAMIEATRQEIAQRGLSHVTVQQMDAETLQFPDASFDVVCCGFAIFFFPQLEKALAEILRVLRPGGQFVASTWGPEEARWEWRDRLVRAYLPPLEPEEKEESAAAKPVFDTPEGMTAIVTRAGFIQPQVMVDQGDFIYADEETWWQTQWSHGARRGVEAIQRHRGTAGLQQFKAAAFDQLQPLRQPDGFHQIYQALYTLAGKE
jgi:ubiquinone/menaquinone biosynthesis C-methylase UbiE